MTKQEIAAEIERLISQYRVRKSTQLALLITGKLELLRDDQELDHTSRRCERLMTEWSELMASKHQH